MLSKRLSPKKIKFISLINNEDIINYQVNDLINELEISKPTYYRWLKDKELAKIVAQENALKIGDLLPEFIEKLTKKALQGDLRAIKIFLDIYDNRKYGRNITDGLTPDEIITIIRMARNGKNDRDNKN